MRTHVIVNTTANLYRNRPETLDRIRRAAGARARVFATSSFEDLDRACDEIAKEGTDCVAISGGDGTFMAGVTALTRAFGDLDGNTGTKLPLLALLPGGTVATVARNWQSMGAAPDLLADLVRSGASVRRALRPTLRVRDASATRIGFIFGTGLVAKFFGVYYEEGAGGHRGAARIVARVFLESFYGGAYARRVLDPLPCTIEVDGKHLQPSAWSLVCCSVVRDLGIHMLVNYRAGEDLERPHLVASALSSSRLGPRMPFVLAGRSIGGKDHFDDLTRAFTVRFGGVGPYVLDGDILRSPFVTVSAGPSIEVACFESRA
jgi:diacylglycerol kinase family enzyme